ncbi:hypothetical protein [Martelella endophytica]|uniref:hypothetical protein n=1 Tax=Martelella endophytica TaxID=1486262 RepID=UPI00130EBCD9|nr:hypothetical protein [Martelella endophytica]
MATGRNQRSEVAFSWEEAMPAPKLRVLESAIAIREHHAGSKQTGAIYAFVNIEVKGRGIATGRGCLPLLDEALPERAFQCAEAYTSFRFFDTAYGIHRERAWDVAGSGASSTAMRSSCYLLDAAILDALLCNFGLNFFRGMMMDIAGIDGRARGLPDNRSLSRYLTERRTRGSVNFSKMFELDATESAELIPDVSESNARATTAVLSARPKTDTSIFLLYERILAEAAGEETSVLSSELVMASGEPLFVAQACALAALLQRHDETCPEPQRSMPAFRAALLRPGFASSDILTPSNLRWL